MKIEEYILNVAKDKMEHYAKLDNATSIEMPVGTVELKSGIQAQVILKVVTEKHDFLVCGNYFNHK